MALAFERSPLSTLYNALTQTVIAHNPAFTPAIKFPVNYVFCDLSILESNHLTRLDLIVYPELFSGGHFIYSPLRAFVKPLLNYPVKELTVFQEYLDSTHQALNLDSLYSVLKSYHPIVEQVFPLLVTQRQHQVPTLIKTQEVSNLVKTFFGILGLPTTS